MPRIYILIFFSILFYLSADVLLARSAFAADTKVIIQSQIGIEIGGDVRLQKISQLESLQIKASFKKTQSARFAHLYFPHPDDAIDANDRNEINRIRNETITFINSNITDIDIKTILDGSQNAQGPKLLNASIKDGNLISILLHKGWAILFSDNLAKQEFASFMADETIARNNNVGLWKLKTYQTINANNNDYDFLPPPRLILMKGRIKSYNMVGNLWYFNIGDDWTKDATIYILKNHWQKFNKVKDFQKQLLNKHILARGWGEIKQGLALEVIHPQHIYILP